MNRFEFDLAAQKRVRDLVLGPGLYGPNSVDGRYVYIDKGRLATILQKQFEVDTILQSLKTGAALAIEEKIVRGVYDKIALETHSCTIPGHESQGWIYYGKADLLNWVMCREDGCVDCYMMDFPLLQKRVLATLDRWRETICKQNNRTACRLVPLSWVKDKVGYAAKTIHPTHEGAQAVREYLSTHYQRNVA